MTLAVRDAETAAKVVNPTNHEHDRKEFRMRLIDDVEPGRIGFAVMTPPAMEELLFISSYEQEDPNSNAPRHHGYQREPMWSRIPGIARYYMADDNRYLVTPILVSVRLEEPDDIQEFSRLFNAGEADAIHRRWHRAVASIVDGQHRFLGLVRGHNLEPDFNPLVPVMLYFAMDFEHEAQVFDIINSTQRKLPKALIETTAGDIIHAGAKDYAQTVRTIAFALARDEDSVWYDQVNMTGAYDRARKVTYEGIRRSTENMFPVELFGRLKTRGLSPEAVAKQYWRMVSEACRSAWDNQPTQYDEEGDPITAQYRIRELVGVASLAKLGRDIVISALEAPDFDERMAELVSMLSEVDWEKREGNPWMASQAGFAGQKDLYTMLYNLVYNGIRPGDPVVE